MTTLPEAVKNAWHIVALSKQIKTNRTYSFTVTGVPVVLFRNDSDIGGLIDRCPHRNYPLSKGRIYKGAVECPYHGWRFDQSGACVDVPGCKLPNDSNNRLSAQSVRVKERHGAVFVCLSPDTADEPALPPYLGDPKYDHFWWQQGTWQGRAFDAIENVMDPFHTNHLHHGFIRRRDNRMPVTLQVNSQGTNIDMVIEQTKPDLGIMSRFLEKDRSKSISQYFPPTIVQARWQGEQSLTLCVTAFFTPSAEYSFMPFACFTTPRGLVPNWLKERAIRLFLSPVVAQDRDALAKQAAVMQKFGAPKYVSGPGDLLGNRLFQLWNGERIETGSDAPVKAEL